MMSQDIHHIKKFILFVICSLFLFHLSAIFFRYSRIPEWGTLIHGIIVFLSFLYILFWILTESKLLRDHLFCKLIIILTYISRGIIAIINEHYPILPKLGDVSYYHNMGIDYSRELLIQGSGIGASAFGNYIIGIIYLILGQSPVLICLINSFLYSITVLILILICRELKFYNYWIVALTALVLPSSYLYIPVMLRESIFLLFSVLLFYRLVILYGKESRSYNEHLIIIILLLLATSIRPQVFPIFILIYMISLIYYQRGWKKIVTVTFFLLSILIVSFSGLTLFQFVDSNLLNLYYFQLYRNAFSDLPNAYLVNIVYRDWWDFISYFPSFIIHFLFAPYPWVSSSYKFFMATIDSIVTIIIMFVSILIVIGNYRAWKKHIILAIVCFFIFLIPFSMIEAYPMGAVRHRMILTLMVLPIFSCVLPNNYISFSEDK